MLINKRYLLAIVAVSIPLMAAKCTGEVKTTCPPGDGCTHQGTIRVETEFLVPNGEGGSWPVTTESGDAFDAADFEIDVSGSSSIPEDQGLVTVSLVDSTSGVVQASQAFGWVLSGSRIVLDDPNAVNQWAMQNAGSADSLSYAMHPFAVTQHDGWNTLSMTDSYDGETLASSFLRWRGQQCPYLVRGNGDKNKHPTIIHCP